MANRRMFSNDIADTDKFLEMPPTSQSLYFHLGLKADDDGFVASPKKIARACSSSEEDLKILEDAKFIITFPSGVIVITDWQLNNYIRQDRYKPTIYVEEKKHLITTETKAYQYQENVGMSSGIPMVNQMATQYSIEQDSKEQNSIGQERLGQHRLAKHSKEQVSLVSADCTTSNEPTFDVCCDLYCEKHLLGNIDRSTLERLYKEHGGAKLHEAIFKTISNDEVQSPLAYITGILNDWKAKGLETLEDIRNEEEERQEEMSDWEFGDGMPF